MEENELTWLLDHDFSNVSNLEKLNQFIMYDDTDIEKLTKSDLQLILPNLDIFLSSEEERIRKKALFLFIYFLQNSKRILQDFKEIFNLPMISQMICLNHTCYSHYLENEITREKEKKQIQNNIFKNLFKVKQLLEENKQKMSFDLEDSYSQIISFHIRETVEDDFSRLTTLEKLTEEDFPNFEMLLDPLQHIYLFFDKRTIENIELEIISAAQNESPKKALISHQEDNESKFRRIVTSISPARLANLSTFNESKKKLQKNNNNSKLKHLTLFRKHNGSISLKSKNQPIHEKKKMEVKSKLISRLLKKSTGRQNERDEQQVSSKRRLKILQNNAAKRKSKTIMENTRNTSNMKANNSNNLDLSSYSRNSKSPKFEKNNHQIYKTSDYAKFSHLLNEGAPEKNRGNRPRNLKYSSPLNMKLSSLKNKDRPRFKAKREIGTREI